MIVIEPKPTLDELLDRVADLETRNKEMLHRIMEMTDRLMSTPPTTSGDQHAVAATVVRARRVEIVDIDGNTRITLGTSPGNTEIVVHDEYGLAVLMAGHFDGHHSDWGSKEGVYHGRTFFHLAQGTDTKALEPEYSAGQLDGTLCAHCGRATVTMRPLKPEHEQRAWVDRLDRLQVCEPECRVPTKK
jgi:hypothetical protein